MTVEAQHATVGLAPGLEGAVVMVAAARDTQVGLVRRLLAQACQRAPPGWGWPHDATPPQALGTLAAMPGVRAALAATESDGLPAATVAALDVDADALAAFATALFNRTRLANAAAGYGETRQLSLDAEHGRVCSPRCRGPGARRAGGTGSGRRPGQRGAATRAEERSHDAFGRSLAQRPAGRVRASGTGRSLAVALEPSGRVLAQHGFTRSLDVMAVCSLVAAIHASASELGRQANGAPFGPLHHSGPGRQVFLAPAHRRTGPSCCSPSSTIARRSASSGIFSARFAQSLSRVE